MKIGGLILALAAILAFDGPAISQAPFQSVVRDPQPGVHEIGTGQAPPVSVGQQGSSSSTLEIAPQMNSAQEGGSLPEPSQLPSEPVLVIPRASRQFVGQWGGRLGLTNSYGRLPAPPDAPVSLLFSERHGEVYLRTTVFAGPNANVLQTSADVLDPHEVVLTIKGIQFVGMRRPIRHIEKLRLKLTDSGRIEISKYVDLYLPGDSRPFAEADYRGALHQLTGREEQSFEREIREGGEIPQATIRARRAISPP
jgi:hypothetical protein